jgi:hypothetical protein
MIFRIIHGGNGLFDGPVNDENLKKNQKNLRKKNFLHVDETMTLEKTNRHPKKFSIPREQYLSRYGPTTGDRVNRKNSVVFVEYDCMCHN